MIPREIIDEIFETARIEEVIGEFVQLKKKGQNYAGLSPFSNEKTPSFYVSATKGIYKDFSSGKGGNVVGFLMEHEHFSYPEALRYLAKKYNIEIPEVERTPEEEIAANARESLYIVNQFALEFSMEQLWETDEGKSIGLSYFKQRGFSDEIIKEFELGYFPEDWEAFSKAATAKGYNKEYLLNVGLSKEKNDRLYDAYRGRVTFPIHNLSGRVLGFGGRTLKTDKKIPKYINSPESEIYHKSNVLYGMAQAKKYVAQQDQCLLVEGYTDVVSLAQAGVRNVVASSGTALTQGQIRLIHRYTKNVVILYDSDPAGIKASFRGIDLILEEGMNVKVVLFPEGEDPDSYSRKNGAEAVREYIDQNAKDFIVFKTDVLLAETQGDPIKKAGLIHEIVDSIARIPDAITQAIFIQECSRLLDIEEHALNIELRKATGKQVAEKSRTSQRSAPDMPPPDFMYAVPDQEQATKSTSSTLYQEQDLIRKLMVYGDREITFDIEDESGEIQPLETTVAEYIFHEISIDELSFSQPALQSIFDKVAEGLEAGELRTDEYFIRHSENDVQQVVVDLIANKYVLSNWESQHIYVETEELRLRKAVQDSVYHFKLRRIEALMEQKQLELKAMGPQAEDQAMLELLAEIKKLNLVRQQIAAVLGSAVTK